MAELATWVGSLPGVATCWNTLVSTVQWVNALPPVLGALVGGVVMLAVLYVAIRLWIFTKFMYTIEQLPGPLALPWLGNSLQLMSLMNRPKAWMHTHDENARAEAEKFRETLPFIDWARDFQPLFRLWVGPIPAVIITDPSVARLVLGPSGPLTKSSIYKFIHPWLKTGLLTSGGNKWKARRKLITPSFHFDVLNHYFKIFIEESNTLCDRFEAGCSLSEDGSVHVYTYVTNATLAIISKCAFGSQVAAQALPGEPQSEYVRAVNCQTESLFKRVLQPWTWSNHIYYNLTSDGRKNKRSLKILHSYTRSVIQERKAVLEAMSPEQLQQHVPSHFLDMLLLAKDTNGNKLDDNGVAEEVDTFMFEGHDTTASALTWAMYYIGCFPDIQERLYDEVDSLLTENPTPTVSQVKSLSFLTAVVKESLRLSSPVPFLGRNVDKPMRIGKHYIPPGAQVLVCPVILHHHEDTWADSWEFKPERFMEGFGFDAKPIASTSSKGAGVTNRRGRTSSSDGAPRQEPFAFLPFSAGSRGCIGRQFALLEEKVVLMTLLRRFKWTTVRDQDIYIETGIIMRPAGGKLRIHFEPRQPVSPRA